MEAKIASLKTTMLSLYAMPRRDSHLIAILNAAHRELFQLTGEVLSFGEFVRVA